ncbi:hypothetical protein [Glycomyces tritici]|uniref:Uncharacterized protein n=1 Tax=Glycomyces tritici TaxID=2665176 RepID=A0ABT7YQK6_9ACTN|nr:hypothetical protein [Glycomyces tritici]MDN3240887.1 hypothetical protein [Glycomyces tritici]MDN3242910.1 hypothetical protein [Glycomyces tritici]
MPNTSLRVVPPTEQDQRELPEVLGEWTTEGGTTLSLVGKASGQYASIWMQRDGGMPRKIGRVEHAGGVLRSTRWEELWRQQTAGWKEIQRSKAAAILADWHAARSDA